MSQYIRFSFRLAQDFLNLGLSIGIKAIEYLENTLTNWSKFKAKVKSKKYWNCTKCQTKFDLALTQQAKTCIMCRLKESA
jgi:hypothetical protein